MFDLANLTFSCSDVSFPYNKVDCEVTIQADSDGNATITLNPLENYNKNTTIRVSIGDGITTNHDAEFELTINQINDDPDILHTVTASFSRNYFGESATRMNYLLPNEEWAFKFIDEGSFKYFCAPHPWMTGNIIVL